MKSTRDNHQKANKQLLIFFCDSENVVFDSGLEAELPCLYASARTLKHAINHMKKFNGDTSVIVISDQGKIVDLSAAENNLHEHIVLATNEKKHAQFCVQGIRTLSKQSSVLIQKSRHYSKALMFGIPGVILTSKQKIATKEILDRCMSDNSFVRVQICQFYQSGIRDAIPDSCRVSIPRAWSVIAHNDTRAIDFDTKTDAEFDVLKVRLANILKPSKLTKAICNEVNRTIAFSNISYHKKRVDALNTLFRGMWRSPLSHLYSGEDKVKDLAVSDICVIDGEKSNSIKSKAYTICDAAENGDLVYVKKYHEGKSINLRNIATSVLHPLCCAMEKEHDDLVHFLMTKLHAELFMAVRNAQNEDGLSMLHIAACTGYESVAEQFIKAGSDINSKDKYGITPLGYAVSIGNMEIAQLLLYAGANPNIEDEDEYSPLEYAANDLNIDMVKLLITNGAIDKEGSLEKRCSKANDSNGSPEKVAIIKEIHSLLKTNRNTTKADIAIQRRNMQM